MNKHEREKTWLFERVVIVILIESGVFCSKCNELFIETMLLIEEDEPDH